MPNNAFKASITSLLMGIIRRLKVLLASRNLFHNWLSAGIKYYLTKVGLLRLVNIEVTCGDGSKGLIPVRAYGVLVNDYYDGYATNYDCKDGIATYVNNVHVSVKEIREGSDVRLAIRSGWVYYFTNGFWFKNGIRFRHMYWLILTVFDNNDYEPLNVGGKTVVDVGAYVGDSAIYFALKGAERVIAIEPHPSAYIEMLDNIKLNNLEGVIVPVNAGLASRPGKICIEYNVNTSNTGVIYHRPGDCPITVPAVTLGELIGRFSINVDDAVLKMDCEGCEYDVILNDYEHVRLFRELILEYHSYAVNKSADDLLMTLNRDYKCEMKGDNNQGIIHCIRK
jgi:FkbM family methyltransferase